MLKTLGPPDAPIAIVLDAPAPGDMATQLPLSTFAGARFFQILSSKGILKTSTFVCTLLDNPLADADDEKGLLSPRKTCPGPLWEKEGDFWVSPALLSARQRVNTLLAEVRPRIVITLGNLALWAMTGKTGARLWRGSRLQPSSPAPFQILPTLNPGILVTDPSQAHLFQIDLGRAKALYEGTQLPREYRFTVAPTFQESLSWLVNAIALADTAAAENRTLLVSGDIETRMGHIACIGLATDPDSAICIPFLQTAGDSPFYWPNEDEETVLVYHIARLFLHPAVVCVGQNYLYDCQYYARHWGFTPRRVADTMIGHHSIYSNMRKGLAFLSSLYARDHIYWKDDIDDWNPALGERQFWEYNCKDACITLECWTGILETLAQENARCATPSKTISTSSNPSSSPSCG